VKHRRTALIVAGLSALGPFSTDTYFPSFPAIAAQFHVSAIQVQSTLSIYLVALAVMNLFHGALSDSFGRQRVILVSLGVYSVSAAACVVAPSFGWLLGLRVVQGLAAGAGMIVSRALIRDRFDGADAQKFMAQVAMVSGAGPVIAPIFGGWLHVWFGWRGPFVFLACLGVLLLVACRYGLPETLPHHLRQPFHPARLARSYVAALGHAPFVLLCASLAFGGGGFLLYVATAPDMVLNILRLSETQFGWLFIPIVSGLIFGSAVTSKAAGRISPGRLVSVGFLVMSLGAMVNVLVNLLPPLRVPWSVLPLTVYTFGFALMAPVATIQSLDLFPTRKGLASSLQGFAHIIVFALISSIGARFVFRSGINHAYGLAIMMLASCLSYYGYRRLAPSISHANQTSVPECSGGPSASLSV
jgi:MFS transporter, DHA1 family, multidrug resistance protein